MSHTFIDSTLQQAQLSLAQGDSAQAASLLKQALSQTGDHAALWAALGVALRFEARWDAAASAFQKALELEPGRADAQVHLGMIRLTQGRQDEGWPLYQARWRAAHWPERLRYPAQALWAGRVSAGTRLLLWCEQGLGDSLQFARYVPWLQNMLQAHGASLLLEVPKALHRLLQSNWPTLEVTIQGQARGRFDAHLPLMDLPDRWGGVGPGLLPYQTQTAPYLALPAQPLAATLATLCPSAPLCGHTAPPLRVGIVWQGRPSHPDDRIRSIAPAAFQPLFNLPGLAWVSLQKEAGEHPDWLPRTMDSCQDFLDTARVLQSLDVVLTIDSAVAHLAGAMGKPVWVLLPPVADWRWGLEGDTTPWYPSMRLFRRAASEGWQDVMARVAAALTARLPPVTEPPRS